MAVSVDINNMQPPTEEEISAARARLGRVLSRLRSSQVRTDGKRLAAKDIAKITGLSATTITNAERGRMSLDTLLCLWGFYDKDLSRIEVFDLLDDEVSGNYVPFSILRKLSDKYWLKATEFLRTVSIFPEQEYRVTYKAYIEIASLGFATRAVIKEDANEYYAATVEYAALRDDLNWRLPKKLFNTAFSELDEEDTEFVKWAQRTLMNAAKDNPKFAKRLDFDE